MLDIFKRSNILIIKKYKIMKKYLFIIFIFTIILNTGCEKFTKGLVVDLEIPEHEPVLTPYCFINDADSTVMVIVQKSQGALENSEIAFIENATVELYKNGTLWNTIPYNDSDTAQNNGVYEFPMNDAFANEGYGDSYELRISAPDFEPTSATQVMPVPIQIEAIQFIENGGVNTFGEASDNMKITFTDPVNEENYYKIQVKSQYLAINKDDDDTTGPNDSYYIEPLTSSLGLESGYGNSLILSDKLFNGQSQTIDLGIYRNIFILGIEVDWEVNFEVTLLSITRDEYLYQKSLVTYSNSSFSLFAEPTLIHTNTSSGLGVFSMMSTDIKEADFKF
jgi:hypothetical protein